jgi:hypothetical protein
MTKNLRNVVIHPESHQQLQSATRFVLKKLVSPDSQVLQEINTQTKEIQSTLEYEPQAKRDLQDGICLLPKWMLVLGILFLFSITIIFLAALITVMGAKNAAVYGESCSDRSCTKNLNLKCIDKICNCSSNEYYSNKCLPKKTYLKKCNEGMSMCLDNISLICTDGTCKCLNTQYWNGSKCVSRLNYKEKCNGDTCLTTFD